MADIGLSEDFKHLVKIPLIEADKQYFHINYAYQKIAILSESEKTFRNIENFKINCRKNIINMMLFELIKIGKRYQKISGNVIIRVLFVSFMKQMILSDTVNNYV